MTTLPAWTQADWADGVAEPFRSDRAFWNGLAASADALVTLAAAIAVAVVLVLTGERAWSALPFVVPAVLTVRAARISRASSRRSREAFDNRRAWRDAEREAVASAFFRVLGRHRGGASHAHSGGASSGLSDGASYARSGGASQGRSGTGF